MKLSTKISASYILLTILLVICGSASYYSINSLGDSIRFLTGPAWETADGAMEGSIEISAQIMANEKIIGGFGNSEQSENTRKASIAQAESALSALAATGLLQADQVQREEAQRKVFQNDSDLLYREFKSFKSADDQLESNFFEFFELMVQAENVGVSAIEPFRDNPNRQTSWNDGLGESWAAADGSMEATIDLLENIYYYSRLVQNPEDKNAVEGLNTARMHLDDSLPNIIGHPYFQAASVGHGKYQGDNYSRVLRTLWNRHTADFDSAVERLNSLHNIRIKYTDSSEQLLGTLVDIEMASDQKVQSEVDVTNNVIDGAELTIFLLSLFSIIVAAAMGVIIVRSINLQLGTDPSILENIAEFLAKGQLNIKRNTSATGVYGSINRTIDKLIDVIGGIKSGAIEVANAAEQVSQGNTNLSQRTQEQASALEEVASSIEQIASAVNQNAGSAQQANELASAAREQAERGGKVVGQTISAMSDINSSSKRIEDIIVVIDEIAFQTNLLALNAAVEAARAGEQGRGFAVVASEVRNLAGRSATAAKEIKTLIQDSVVQVEGGTKLVDESGTMLQEIVASVKEVSDIVAEIASASQEQSEGIEQVNKAVIQMDSMTQHNASLVEESEAASEAMGAQAQELTASVAYFKLGRDEGDARIQRTVPVSIASPTISSRQAPVHSQPVAALSQSQRDDAADEENWKEFLSCQTPY